MKLRDATKSGGLDPENWAGETHYLVESGDGAPFAIVVEPEGMEYSLPPHEKVLLVLKARRPGPHYVSLVHRVDSVTIWRPSDRGLGDAGGWHHRTNRRLVPHPCTLAGLGKRS